MASLPLTLTIIAACILAHVIAESPTVDDQETYEQMLKMLRSYSEDGLSEDKRAEFSPWGGKRGFNPWGGKRSAEKRSWVSDDYVRELIKKGFNPWGGKRAAFQPWGGKRSVSMDNEDRLLHRTLEEEEEKGYKRGFQPWGGKRTFNAWGGKRGFNPWGGKRSFEPWGGKRGFNPWGGKRGFNPWGGKRSETLDDDFDLTAMDKSETNST